MKPVMIVLLVLQAVVALVARAASLNSEPSSPRREDAAQARHFNVPRSGQRSGARTSPSGRTSSALRLTAHKDRALFLAVTDRLSGVKATNSASEGNSLATTTSTTGISVLLSAKRWRASEAAFPSTLPKVKHKKEAGGGYKEGSPLYEKQEAMKGVNAQSADDRVDADEPTFSNLMQNLTYDITDFAAAVTGNGSPEQEEQAWEWFYGTAISQTAYVVLVLIVAYIYRLRAPELRAPGGLESTEEWAYGLCDCRDLGEDARICGLSCCCPAIRWADTISDEKVARLSFWQGLALVLLLVFLGPFTGEASLCVLLCICVYYRQQLRKVFGHSPFSAQSYFFDFITYCCCSCCAIVQEAREVEKVRRAQF